MRPFTDTSYVKRSKPRWVLVGLQLIWPLAQELLDRLMAAEATASSHDIVGPAASSNAWPLDGHFNTFELTPANEPRLLERAQRGETRRPERPSWRPRARRC